MSKETARFWPALEVDTGGGRAPDGVRVNRHWSDTMSVRVRERVRATPVKMGDVVSRGLNFFLFSFFFVNGKKI